MTIPNYIRRTWHHMRHRCYNPNYQTYKWYGARGIKMCDRWLNNCEAFYEDVGDRPSDKHSIDRIDNDGDYTPDNCRWCTQDQQIRNKRGINMITHNGETKCLTDWAKDIGIHPTALVARLRRHSVEVAVTTPKQRHHIKRSPHA